MLHLPPFNSYRTSLAGLVSALIAVALGANWITHEQATAAGLLAASVGLGFSGDAVWGVPKSRSKPPR